VLPPPARRDAAAAADDTTLIVLKGRARTSCSQVTRKLRTCTNQPPRARALCVLALSKPNCISRPQNTREQLRTSRSLSSSSDTHPARRPSTRGETTS
jgi:hypothetical protein